VAHQIGEGLFISSDAKQGTYCCLAQRGKQYEQYLISMAKEGARIAIARAPCFAVRSITRLKKDDPGSCKERLWEFPHANPNRLNGSIRQSKGCRRSRDFASVRSFWSTQKQPQSIKKSIAAIELNEISCIISENTIITTRRYECKTDQKRHPRAEPDRQNRNLQMGR
jgi:hypothetical protein